MRSHHYEANIKLLLSVYLHAWNNSNTPEPVVGPNSARRNDHMQNPQAILATLIKARGQILVPATDFLCNTYIARLVKLIM